VEIRTILEALAFAAEKHRNQRRKDREASPYINHPIAVAAVLASEGQVTDGELLIAALLHDTIEDTLTTAAELATRFGAEVADLVLEVTDDKSLPKAERKSRQVAHAPHASARAKQLKIADKICNIRDIASAPPSGWSLERREEYLDWTERVVRGCRGVNAALDRAYDETLRDGRQALRSEPEASGEKRRG